MTSKYSYLTIDRNATAEFRDRGSTFIAYAYPIETTDEFKKILQQLKKEHPKAVHHCFAYRLGIDENSWRVSDDGEPSGSAGRPILGQIDSRDLTNVLIVVVRYFGGTLLGIPGLINAYRTAASMALQLTAMIQKKVLVKYNVQFNYTQLNDVMQVFKSNGCEIPSRDMQLFCNVTALIPKDREEHVLYSLKELPGVEVLP